MKTIGSMNIIGEIKSFDFKKDKDVFKISGSPTEDHVWPISRNGSNDNKNLQTLSKESNMQKSYELKGVINGVRFSIMNLFPPDEFGKPIGTMFISYNNGIEWYEVTK